MPKPRTLMPGDPVHIVRRGHNRSDCFRGDEDRALYISLLSRFALETRTLLHAYVLMSNHVHLLATPTMPLGASRLMHKVGLHYSKAINRKLGRTGTLWEERFYAAGVRTDPYVLACHRYIELNPVRAGIVRHPLDYRWSSYASNAGLEDCAWLSVHPTLAALGPTAHAAAARYRDLFDSPIDDVVLAELRHKGEPPAPTDVPRSRG